jgi:hypothetical protein
MGTISTEFSNSAGTFQQNHHHSYNCTAYEMSNCFVLSIGFVLFRRYRRQVLSTAEWAITLSVSRAWLSFHNGTLITILIWSIADTRRVASSSWTESANREIIITRGQSLCPTATSICYQLPRLKKTDTRPRHRFVKSVTPMICPFYFVPVDISWPVNRVPISYLIALFAVVLFLKKFALSFLLNKIDHIENKLRSYFSYSLNKLNSLGKKKNTRRINFTCAVLSFCDFTFMH